MGALSKILRSGQGNSFLFYCPGCQSPHVIAYGEGPGLRWTWDGDVDKPTVSPSLLCEFPVWEPRADLDDDVAEKVRRGEIQQTKREVRCHLFMRNGQLIFLADSNHALSGQTVDIPEFPY